MANVLRGPVRFDPPSKPFAGLPAVVNLLVSTLALAPIPAGVQVTTSAPSRQPGVAVSVQSNLLETTLAAVAPVAPPFVPLLLFPVLGRPDVQCFESPNLQPLYALAVASPPGASSLLPPVEWRLRYVSQPSTFAFIPRIPTGVAVTIKAGSWIRYRTI